MVLVEVIGVDPPCKRCTTAQKNAEEAALRLEKEGLSVIVKKLDMSSKETLSKYGVVLSPALAVNGKVRVAGRIPSPDEIVRLIKQSGPS